MPSKFFRDRVRVLGMSLGTLLQETTSCMVYWGGHSISDSPIKPARRIPCLGGAVLLMLHEKPHIEGPGIWDLPYPTLWRPWRYGHRWAQVAPLVIGSGFARFICGRPFRPIQSLLSRRQATQKKGRKKDIRMLAEQLKPMVSTWSIFVDVCAAFAQDWHSKSMELLL